MVRPFAPLLAHCGAPLFAGWTSALIFCGDSAGAGSHSAECGRRGRRIWSAGNLTLRPRPLAGSAGTACFQWYTSRSYFRIFMLRPREGSPPQWRTDTMSGSRVPSSFRRAAPPSGYVPTAGATLLTHQPPRAGGRACQHQRQRGEPQRSGGQGRAHAQALTYGRSAASVCR